MENLKEFLGCRCHANSLFSKNFDGPNVSISPPKIPAHTFSWASYQYPEDRPVWPTNQSLDLVVDIEKEELSGSNTITLRALQKNVSSFSFDAADLKIHSVQ